MQRIRRKFATGALLGLPAALLAHFLVFGNAHAAGGSAHGALVDAACAFGFLAALAFAIAACRRIRIAPSFTPIVLGAASWFAGVEFSEHQSAVPLLLSALAILLCSWLIRATVRAFAHVVVAILAAAWIPARRDRGSRRSGYARNTIVRMRPAYRFRIFSRPPPAFLTR